MAIMRLTAMNSGLKGKISGTVFRYSKHGQIAQTCPHIDAIGAGSKLTRADAGKSLDAQKAIVTVSVGWNLLTQADRDGWNGGANAFPFKNRWGVLYTPTGFQVYLSINTRLINSGLAAIPTIPANGGALNAPSFVVTHDAPQQSFIISNCVIPAGYTTQLHASYALSKGRKPIDSNFKVIAKFNNGSVFPFELREIWTDEFGLAPTNGNFWFFMTMIKDSNGQAGLPYYVQVSY